MTPECCLSVMSASMSRSKPETFCASSNSTPNSGFQNSRISAARYRPTTTGPSGSWPEAMSVRGWNDWIN